MCLQWWAKASFQHQVIVTTIPSCICVFGRWFNCLRWWPSRPSPSSYPDSMSYRRRSTNNYRQGMWAEHLVLTGLVSCCNSRGKSVWNYFFFAGTVWKKMILHHVFLCMSRQLTKLHVQQGLTEWSGHLHLGVLWIYDGVQEPPSLLDSYWH